MTTSPETPVADSLAPRIASAVRLLTMALFLVAVAALPTCAPAGAPEQEGGAPAPALEPPPWDGGSLVIIGGGRRPSYVMERIVELAGGPDCRMVVIPMASAEPESTGESQAGQLREAGCPEVQDVTFDRESADSDEVLARFDGVKGVFFSGGVQSRLLDHMAGSRVFERVREIYETGGVLGGTSAGAAVMSEIMITGDQSAPRPDEEGFAIISAGNIVTRRGFGFVTNAIIDQHFVARSRHNRLISLVLEHPELIGIGIDESTAIVMLTPYRLEVLGESIAVIYDASRASAIEANEEGELSAHGIRMHLLRSGQRYDLFTKSVIDG